MNAINRSALLAIVLLAGIGILSVMIFVASVEERIAAKPLVVTLDLNGSPTVASPKAQEPDPDWNASLKRSFSEVPDLSAPASTTAYDLSDDEVMDRSVFFQEWKGSDDEQKFFIAWYLGDGPARVLESGSGDICSGFTFGTTTNGFFIERMDSPCEAGAAFKTDYYDKHGDVIGTSSYAYPSTAFAYRAASADSDLEVSLVYKDEQCSAFNRETGFGFLSEISGEGKVPSAKLTALLVNGRTIALSKSRTVDCGEIYGGGADVPSIGEVEYLGDSISVGLPGGGAAVVSLEKGNKVTFEE